MFKPDGTDITLVPAAGAPGRFTWSWDASGNPRFDNERTHATLTQLLSRRRGRLPGARVAEGGYYWDDTGLRGSLLWTLKQDRASTGSALAAFAEDALQVLVQEHLLAGFAVRPVKLAPGRWRLEVQRSLPSGNAAPLAAEV